MTEPSPDNATDLVEPTEAPEIAEDTSTQVRVRRKGFKGFFLELHDDLFIHNHGPKFTWQDLSLLLILCVLLTIFYYWGRPQYFRFHLWKETAAFLDMSREDEYFRLLPYFYWAIMSVVMRIVLPCLLIVFLLKDRIRDYGYRLVGEVAHARIYLMLYFFMLPLVIGVSFTEAFQGKYPFYKGSMDGLDHFLLYQLCYGIQFVALEAFFRGFVLFALFKRFGYYAIAIMTVPYCMIHFGKPAAETLGAIFAGLALGYLALKSKSWVHGAMLHWSVGITMDVLAIFQKGGFKS